VCGFSVIEVATSIDACKLSTLISPEKPGKCTDQTPERSRDVRTCGLKRMAN
jgi:hypothetical protein